MGLTVGVDASRNRSGGAKAHLNGIFSEGDPREYGIDVVHVWAYRGLMEALPERTWLVKHAPPALEGSLLRQIFWQRFHLPREFRATQCDILLNTDAATVSTVSPTVTMSRDMLSYEPGEMERFGISRARLRLILLKYIQNLSLRRADGVIFLTRYAGKLIQDACGPLANVAYIPHGIGDSFRSIPRRHSGPGFSGRTVECLYVSNAALYKHQWNVVKAIEQLRARGVDIALTLVGGGKGRAQEMLERQIAESDPEGAFVVQKGYVPQAELPAWLSEADIFVFASSCENMPNTLLEAMAAGLPIACAARGPMPEVLKDAGSYFDPEDPESIATAIMELVTDHGQREEAARSARGFASQYSWENCANETWKFLADTYRRICQ